MLQRSPYLGTEIHENSRNWISYAKFDHTLYSIKYGISTTNPWYLEQKLDVKVYKSLASSSVATYHQSWESSSESMVKVSSILHLNVGVTV